jgi:acetoin utilization deacetylase AcuC-like enzyme
VRRVGLYDDSLFREHDAGEGHPEAPARLEAVRRGLREAGLEARLIGRTPRPVTREELQRVHTAEHVDRIASSQGRTMRFDPDTQAGPRSYEAALLAAGAVVDAVDQVVGGDLDRAFCCVRPPGHHAESDRAMGFCLFNNVAVAAAHALARGLERVLVVDFDVHHGNGTQAIFWEDPRVLYVSSHAYPFYPGTGGLAEVGEGKGEGFTVNLPLGPGTGDAEYARVYRDFVVPIGRAFDPQLLIVSAGFDPYADDPLAPMQVTRDGFGEVARACLETTAGSAGGRAVVALEGGYHPEGLAGGAAATVEALLGVARPHVAPAQGGEIEHRLEVFQRTLSRYWPALRG